MVSVYDVFVVAGFGLQLMQMMRASGLHPAAYWLGSGCFCFFLSFKTTLWLFVFAYLFGVATFTNSYFPLFFVLALFWGLATTGYSFFLGAVRAVRVTPATRTAKSCRVAKSRPWSRIVADKDRNSACRMIASGVVFGCAGV